MASAELRIIFHVETSPGMHEVHVEDACNCTGKGVSWRIPADHKPRRGRMSIVDLIKLGSYYKKEGYKVVYCRMDSWEKSESHSTSS